MNSFNDIDNNYMYEDLNLILPAADDNNNNYIYGDDLILPGADDNNNNNNNFMNEFFGSVTTPQPSPLVDPSLVAPNRGRGRPRNDQKNFSRVSAPTGTRPRGKLGRESCGECQRSKVKCVRIPGSTDCERCTQHSKVCTAGTKDTRARVVNEGQLASTRDNYTSRAIDYLQAMALMRPSWAHTMEGDLVRRYWARGEDPVNIMRSVRGAFADYVSAFPFLGPYPREISFPLLNNIWDYREQKVTAIRTAQKQMDKTGLWLLTQLDHELFTRIYDTLDQEMEKYIDDILDRACTKINRWDIHELEPGNIPSYPGIIERRHNPLVQQSGGQTPLPPLPTCNNRESWLSGVYSGPPPEHIDEVAGTTPHATAHEPQDRPGSADELEEILNIPGLDDEDRRLIRGLEMFNPRKAG
ncbi:hypothetical protein BJ170DRAFT_686000 [Xylariales sp. AK1849]|nr:hypothetical protein BJ170DRAFT_686000 [Xylariales sp. AK1849]